MKIIESKKNGVELIYKGDKESFLNLYSKNSESAYLEKILNNWMMENAKILMTELLNEYWRIFSQKTGYIQKPDLSIGKISIVYKRKLLPTGKIRNSN